MCSRRHSPSHGSKRVSSVVFFKPASTFVQSKSSKKWLTKKNLQTRDRCKMRGPCKFPNSRRRTTPMDSSRKAPSPRYSQSIARNTYESAGHLFRKPSMNTVSRYDSRFFKGQSDEIPEWDIFKAANVIPSLWILQPLQLCLSSSFCPGCVGCHWRQHDREDHAQDLGPLHDPESPWPDQTFSPKCSLRAGHQGTAGWHFLRHH